MKKTYANRVKDLKEITKVQCSKGNYDIDEYMRGAANGLLLAVSIFDDKEPKFLESPKKKWYQFWK